MDGKIKSVIRNLPVAGSFYSALWRAKRLREIARDFTRFKTFSAGNNRFRMEWRDRLLMMGDNSPTTGFDRHYIYHPAWAARVLAKIRPQHHVDISSTLHFCTLVSAFIPVRFYDYRPADLRLENLTSDRADLMKLPFDDASVSSLSCMHVIEHIGLGRYGDTIDPQGDVKAMRELARVLAPNGNLLFVTPVGKPVIHFNAHRVYSYSQIVEHFKDLHLVEFTLLPNDPTRGGLIVNAKPEQADAEEYGCGCFWFRRN